MVQMDITLISCLHQKELCVESYIHLQDAFIRDQATLGDIGKMVILPSTYTV